MGLLDRIRGGDDDEEEEIERTAEGLLGEDVEGAEDQDYGFSDVPFFPWWDNTDWKRLFLKGLGVFLVWWVTGALGLEGTLQMVVLLLIGAVFFLRAFNDARKPPRFENGLEDFIVGGLAAALSAGGLFVLPFRETILAVLAGMTVIIAIFGVSYLVYRQNEKLGVLIGTLFGGTATVVFLYVMGMPVWLMAGVVGLAAGVFGAEHEFEGSPVHYVITLLFASLWLVSGTNVVLTVFSGGRFFSLGFLGMAVAFGGTSVYMLIGNGFSDLFAVLSDIEILLETAGGEGEAGAIWIALAGIPAIVGFVALGLDFFGLWAVPGDLMNSVPYILFLSAIIGGPAHVYWAVKNQEKLARGAVRGAGSLAGRASQARWRNKATKLQQKRRVLKKRREELKDIRKEIQRIDRNIQNAGSEDVIQNQEKARAQMEERKERKENQISDIEQEIQDLESRIEDRNQNVRERSRDYGGGR